MSQKIPQELLDQLTRVQMPTGIPNRAPNDHVDVDGVHIPVHHVPALVVGSGAAGLRAAVELKRRHVNVAVLSTGLFSGTSACSGSDKQTIHTAGTSNRGDDFVKCAQDIGGGGAMDKDTAYIESVGSITAFSGLQYMGLPLPQDRFGAVLRYQTDHDDVGRATSCGPRTSRLMVKVLCEEAIRLGVDFLKDVTAIRMLKQQVNGEEVIKGIIAMDRNREDNELGLVLLLCDKLVLATGGPGELYRDSVYPRFCFGSLGMAIESGLKVTNLTESQFGIGTRRTEFPWNLSGTYVQVMPYIYSVDADGNEINFMAEYFRTTCEMVSNIFRKGYQWPFHATRMLGYQSSLVDLAIFIESKKGHSIYMDFNRNPLAVPGDQDFSLERLDDDVRTYLEKNEALQSLPIERLLQMNPLAIELYRMHGKDIEKEPLPFNVNNQHMNGGIDVDIWSQTSLNGCYAIGEVAGTHGVTRPGGAALNAGQVFGARCAQHIANENPQAPGVETSQDWTSDLKDLLSEIQGGLANENGMTMDEVKEEVQSRMSDHAGFICHPEEVTQACDAAKDLNSTLETKGIKFEKTKLAHAFQWKQTALSSEAVLTALNHYAQHGGGSRGARALCVKEGGVQPEARNVDLSAYAFLPEQEKDKTKKIVMHKTPEGWNIEEVDLREMESPSDIHFEKNWGPYLLNQHLEQGFRH